MIQNSLIQDTYRLRIATTEGTYFIYPDEIIRLEASSNYTYIYFTNKTKLVASKVLKEFVAPLVPMGFIRTHKTHLLNRKHISAIRSDGCVVMRDDSRAEVSRRMKREVMRQLTNVC